MPSGRLGDVEISFLDEAGIRSTSTLGKAEAAEVVRGRPVRTFPTYAGQKNYPGLLWTATTGSLVSYESLLERDRLWLADFDPTVLWIASQPFWLSGRDGSAVRRHVPDFMLEHTDGTFTVVDVKPEALLDDPAVVAVLGWTSRLCAARGWRYEVWHGDDPIRLRNVRFLAAGRRVEFIDADALGKVAAASRPGMTIAELESLVGPERAETRPAVLSLLWFGHLATDLTRPLSGESVLYSRGAAA